MRVGIEVGGTFTDLVAIENGNVIVRKVPSTPREPQIGVMNALDAAELRGPALDEIIHGSTVATNAVLERKGARIAFVTTAGFRDLLLFQRQERHQIFDLAYQRPKPIVARRDCYEATERLEPDGSVQIPLDVADVTERLVPSLKAGGYEAVAICFLHAYLNPQHEQTLASILRQHMPHATITCSSEVSLEYREYERASTTALSAYVQPVIDRYLGSLSAGLADLGFRGRFSVMQSNGGRIPAEGMRRNAIAALLSGPAAGVAGALRQSSRSGFSNLITFDMGGTSTDVCLIPGGVIPLAADTVIDGLPVQTPVVDMVTVGAGGGSIAWRDEGELLRVGPHSAGAMPGPACYGRGGTEATITDAHVVRGTLRPEAFLAGTMRIDRAAAQAALKPLAAHLGAGIEGAAESVIRLANSAIVRAIQLVSTERGHDPRDFVLVPYGGAGPLAAAEVAEELGIRTVLVPPHPGAISAYGLLAADFTKVYSKTLRIRVDDRSPATVRATWDDLGETALAEFRVMGLTDGLTRSLTLEMRFVGQGYEVPVELTSAEVADLTADGLLARFEDAHRRIFMHGSVAGRVVEIVALRLRMTRPLTDAPVLTDSGGENTEAVEIRIVERGHETRCMAVPSALLADGRKVAGPALIESYTSTVYVPSGWTAVSDAHSNLILTRSDAQ